jgi:hypothetical protein
MKKQIREIGYKKRRSYSFLYLNYNIVGSEGLTAVTVKSALFWIETPYSSKNARRFGGTYLLRLQCRRVSQARKKQNADDNKNFYKNSSSRSRRLHVYGRIGKLSASNRHSAKL